MRAAGHLTSHDVTHDDFHSIKNRINIIITRKCMGKRAQKKLKRVANSRTQNSIRNFQDQLNFWDLEIVAAIEMEILAGLSMVKSKRIFYLDQGITILTRWKHKEVGRCPLADLLQ